MPTAIAASPLAERKVCFSGSAPMKFLRLCRRSEVAEQPPIGIVYPPSEKAQLFRSAMCKAQA
jgi:hypothetical protein